MAPGTMVIVDLDDEDLLDEEEPPPSLEVAVGPIVLGVDVPLAVAAGLYT
jgi:hypothetical protein